MGVTKYDDMAWKVILAREPIEDSFGPQNFAELEAELRNGGSYQIAWPTMLDSFYRTHNPSLFATEPSTYFSPQQRAFFAGAVEYLTKLFEMETPAWVEKPEFFLDHEYDVRSLEDEISPETTARSRAKTPLEFTRRNIVFEARGLIRL